MVWGTGGGKAVLDVTYERNILPHMPGHGGKSEQQTISGRIVFTLTSYHFLAKHEGELFQSNYTLDLCFIHCDNLKTFSVIMQMLFEVTNSTSLVS